MKHNKMYRALSMLLVFCMVLALLPANVWAADNSVKYRKLDKAPDAVYSDNAAAKEAEENAPYAADEEVRVFIVLEDESAIEKGFSTTGIAKNASAMAYTAKLETAQQQLASRISKEALSGKALEVRWNLTLAANAISANVRYGDIEAISKVEGVKAVYLSPVYQLDDYLEAADPNTISSGNMVGSYNAWKDGYTGAGSLIAIIDTGLDADHPSFDSKAFDYSLLVTATKFGKTVEDYDLLTEADIEAVLPRLNALDAKADLTAKQLHVNSKIAYGFNYIDENLTITHDADSQGDHGTHVAGIAASNRYVPNGDYYTFAESGVVGIAPDAQLAIMKVFGAAGGAYADDYMAAIEDAVMLGCDSVNLSLGSSNVGITFAGNEYMDGLMESLVETDTVVTMSCGNSGYWTEYAKSPNGLPYTEDANTNRVGSPGAYVNSLAVASADNVGMTGAYFTVKGESYVYIDTASVSFASLDTTKEGTDYTYVFLGNPDDADDTAKYGGSADDYKNLDVTGKIVLISRGGGVDFATKQKNAMNAGAAGAIVYNNEAGTINMSLSYNLPCVFIRQDQMQSILAATEKENGVYTGVMQVKSGLTTDFNATGGVITMSSFSAWGVPGNLKLKPEITAPGGNIYSTRDKGTYGSMSGTSMAAPSATGMAAVVAQYIKENGLDKQEGVHVRTLAQSLLMGTAIPTPDPESEVEYSPRKQGAGLANVHNAINSAAYITMDGNSDGKVKAEFGDDPAHDGKYAFSFRVNNLTGKAVSYKLSASVLAAAVENIDGNAMMSLSDVALDADVSFTSAAMDLNGDGKVDENDALAILQHVTGTKLLSKADAAAADLNGNGKVEAVDAQILQDLLSGKAYNGKTLADQADCSTITVPANGSVHVTATITLTEAGRNYLEDNFVNGTYVEGYVYLSALADAEGAATVDQSIPFLGFYGNWSDPSMLDRQKYAEDYFDQKNHTPYLGLAKENYYTTKISGNSGTFHFGMNLFATDSSYIADRNALSSIYGNSIYTLTYSLVRNAAASGLTITNAETGEVYYSADYGVQLGAFYYTNGGLWANTYATKTLRWAGTDADGKALPNNTKVLMSLTLAPEYNVAADGTVSGLGKGAVWTTPVTIDNEDPTVHKMFYSSDALTGEKTLNLEVQDNQYIAAIQVYDESGSKALVRLSPNQQTANEKLTMSINVDEIHEDTVIVAVVDYAGNLIAYEVEIGNGGSGEENPEMNGFFGYLPTTNSWIRFDKETSAEPETVASGSVAFTAAEQVDGYVFATDTDGYLYVMKHGVFEPEIVCKVGYTIQDMAYNKADGKLYGLTGLPQADGSTGYGAIVSIDMLNGTVDVAGVLDSIVGSARSPQVLACDNEGNFYTVTSSTGESELYRFNLDENGGLTEPELIGGTGLKANYIQSMAYDHENEKLYWAQFHKANFMDPGTKQLVELNVNTGEATVLGNLVNETTGFYIVNGASAGFGDTVKPDKVTLTQTDVTLYSGNSLTLEGYVTPWTLKDRGIVWSSSDPSVATVNASGEVTGVKAGTAVITAAAKKDPTVFTTCTVTVQELNATLKGIAYDSDDICFASINADTAEISRLSGAMQEEFISAAYANGRLLAATENALYEVDPENGYKATMLTATAAPFTDMTYCPNLDITLATYGYNLLIVDPDSSTGYSSGWNLKSVFNAIAGVAYAGYDSAYNYFYLLSSSGSIYLVGIEKEGGSYSLSLLSIISTDSRYALGDQISNQSLIYDGETGWIYWTRFDGVNSSSIIAVHEDTEEVVQRGTFADGVWPVVGLYSTESSANLNRAGDFNFDAGMQLATTEFSMEAMEAVPMAALCD